MPDHYSPKLFLQQMPIKLLREFFTHRGELTDLDWNALEEADADEVDVDSIMTAWHALPAPQQADIERRFRAISSLATKGSDRSCRFLPPHTGCTPAKLPNGSQAPCLFDCLKPGQHSKRQRVYEGIGGDKLGWMATCHGRLFEEGVDITPVLTGTCPQCQEQRAYESTCRRAARSCASAPNRREFVEQIRY